MNLLAISYTLPPYLYPQAIQIGRLLNNVSANIGVVCGTVEQHKLGLDCYPEFNNKLIFRLTVPYSPLFAGLLHQLAVYGLPLYGRCPDEYRRWVPKAEQSILDFLPKSKLNPDVIVSFGQPMSDHLLGLRLKQKLNLPWVAHFSDPWSDNLFNRRFFLSNFWNKKMEMKVVREADMVIFTSIETLDLVMSKYPISWRDKAQVLPHGYESHLYPEQSIKNEKTCVLRYLGNFYDTRSPEPLFEALAHIFNEMPEALADVQVELVGSIPKRMLNSSTYKSLPKQLVKIVKTEGYVKSLELMRHADLLLVIDAPVELSVFLPSKLIDYIGAGVPVFGIVPPGTSSQLISRLGGSVANPNNIPEVVSALLSSIEVCKQRRNEVNSTPWGDKKVRAEFQVKTVADNFYNMISHVIE